MSALTPELTGASHPETALPTGQQWTIGHGPFEATVVEVGGGLRTLSRAGVDLVAGYEPHERCASGRGQQLMPWPNRIRDGRYTFEGTERQLPITEVPLGNASHGLVRWALWELVELEEAWVTVGYRLHPQPGWDHFLDLRTTYALDDLGLTVTTAARNVGPTSAPFGYGAHPYLATGDTPLPEVELRIPAREWVEVDDRLLPAARHPAPGGDHDFLERRAVGDQDLDTAYTDVVRDAGRRLAVHGRLDGPRGDPLGRRGLRLAPGLHRDRPGPEGDRRGGSRADDLPGRCLQLLGVARRAPARRGVDRHLGHHLGVTAPSTSRSEICSSDCRA